jgi:hypothetical protein
MRLYAIENVEISRGEIYAWCGIKRQIPEESVAIMALLRPLFSR